MDLSGSQSLCAPIERVLVCPPVAAGWFEATRAGSWRALGYLHPPRPERAEAQHAVLRGALETAGARVHLLPAHAALSLDAVYTHDVSLPTEAGALLLWPGKDARRGEPERHGASYDEMGVPVVGRIEAPATAEGGDLVWLDPRTLLAGRGYRTNAAGIAALRAQLGPREIEVIEAPLIHGQGPEVCLHLMSMLSVLDERVALVDIELLAIQTLELLHERSWQLIEIDPAERDGLACNVLALGERRLLAIEGNPRTNARLAERGFDVRTFPGDEICLNGGGGPTCLTRPIRKRG